MDLGGGFVDTLKLGEGAAEGGWGYVQDALRLYTGASILYGGARAATSRSLCGVTRPAGPAALKLVVEKAQSGSIVVRAGASTYIKGTVTGSQLKIEMLNVAEKLQGKGVSYQLYQRLLAEAGGVEKIKSITSTLAIDNYAAMEMNMAAGMTIQEAAALTPAAKARSLLGYTQHYYDVARGTLTSILPSGG